MKPLLLACFALGIFPPPAAEARNPAPEIPVFAPPSVPAWTARLSRRLQNEMDYPRFPRTNDFASGFVRVRFCVNSDGSLHDVRLVRRSGNKLIDKAALYAVSKLDRLGATPRAVDANRDVEAHLLFAASEDQMRDIVKADMAYRISRETNVASQREPIVLASTSWASLARN